MDTNNNRGSDSKLTEGGEKPTDGLKQEVTSDGSEKNRETLPAKVSHFIDQLRSLSRRAVECPEERAALLDAVHSLAELSQPGDQVDQVVQGGAIDAIVPLLTLFAGHDADPCGECIEAQACLVLGRLASCRAHQKAIADRGALLGLVGLLNRYKPIAGLPSIGASALRSASDAIDLLAYDNDAITAGVEREGGIPPLVALLDSLDPEVQRASAAALRTLAFRNEHTKKQIVEYGGLPTVIQLLRAEDLAISHEAVGLLVYLVDRSTHMTKKVLDEGALQPIIGVLSGKCTDLSRQGAAWLLGEFCACSTEFEAKVVLRGAVPALIEMLGAADVELKKTAAATLGRLAKNADSQAGIVQVGGLAPLLQLMATGDSILQWLSAYALSSLANNEDNIDAFIREGGVQILQDCEVLQQPAQVCVKRTLKRLKERVRGKVLHQTLYTMASSDKLLQRRTATALAHLAREEDLQTVFVDRKGLDILLSWLTGPEQGCQIEAAAAGALFELAKRSNAMAIVDCATDLHVQQGSLAWQYVNNPMLFDVTFVAEGRDIRASRAALRASSQIFRTMVDVQYKEIDDPVIPVPDLIRYAIFKAMMCYVHTGTVEVTSDTAEHLLEASDQYGLKGLKRLCEHTLSSALSVGNIEETFELADIYEALELRKHCVMFALEHFRNLAGSLTQQQFLALMRRMAPGLKEALIEQLTKKKPGGQ